ncbi:hypothetical protein Q9189_006790 [Teloschistes chrysophthalmus]
MHCLPSLTKCLAVLLMVSSLAGADPVRLRRRDGMENGAVHIKRQGAASCSDALCVFSEFLATASYSHSSSTLPIATLQPAKVSSAATTSPPIPRATTTASPTTTSIDTPDGAHIRVSVAQPKLCSESALQFSSVATALPTGVVDIQTETGWGDEGSIWNISASNGVELSDFHVPCQGSACTGITGNTESDGKITKNPDGSWSMNVTANMQPSVGLFGNASGGNPVDGKYDLTITSTPPCALPVFQNCSKRSFDPTKDQWEAYSAGTFLTKYLADNNINSLADLLSKASTQFLPATDAQALICTPDSGKSSHFNLAAVTRMSTMLNLLYSTIDSAQGDMAGYITQIVVKFFQPQAEQEWQAIVTAVSSVVGLLTFIAILIDGFTDFTATPALVAAIVGIQSTLGAAANFKNGFEAQKPDSTYLAIDGNYTQSVIEYVRGLEEAVNNIWSNTELTQSGIATALADGAWLDVPNPYNVTGMAEQARDWLDNLLVTSYINRVFDDADAFIVFLPYAKYVYSGVYGRTELYDFNQQDCENHWANDPSWSYFATCDVPLDPDHPGMAVVTRPSSEGKGSKSWTSGVDWTWAKYTWSAHDMVSSAVTGFGQYGFHYNLTNIDFGNVLNKGSQDAINTWKTLPLSTPGLFNLPVCVLSNMMEIPGGATVATDIGKDATFRTDPFSCVSSNSTATGAKFCDNVSPAIKKAIGCP